MKRDIDRKLQAWKEKKRRKPLIIRGARQVGKTYSIVAFGKNSFLNFIRLDFEKDLSLSRIFSENLDPKHIVTELELYTGQKIIPGKTLLFMDEIQKCERALLSLRYFYEEMPLLHVIAAGSMLEFALETVSFPVGRVSFEWMYPMRFKEFLSAIGNERLAETIPSISNYEPLSQFVHDLIYEQLRIYFITGGMPEVVKEYRDTHSFLEVQEIQKNIIHSYLQSLVHYHKRADVRSLDHVMKNIPKQVGKQIKYRTIDPERRIEKTKTALQILEKALIIHPIHASSAQGLPLEATASSKIFKALYLDIGLMQHACGVDAVRIKTEKDLSNIYQGALVEQFVGQELLSAGGSENRKLYYWSRMKKGSSAEIDYLIIKKGEIYPVEVKSGPVGRLKSMHLYLKEVGAEKGIVLSPATHEKQIVDNILFLPFYTELK